MRLLIVVFLFACPVEMAQLIPPRLVFWQVSHGEWLTWVKNDSCDHFSMGGRGFDLRKVRELCQGKFQRLWLPSLRKEHRSHLSKLQRLEKICLAAAPLKPQKDIQWLAACEEPPTANIHILRSTKSENIAFVLEEAQTLILGDTVLQNEDLRQLRAFKIKNLVLAHHGRKRALSMALLKNLPELRRAFVSDLYFSRTNKRQSRLDPKTKRLLMSLNIPPVATSTWGHLHYFVK